MKEMKPIQVSCQDGAVCLVQLDPFSNEDVAICLTPEQVPLVCKWLREAASNRSAEGR